MVHRKGQHVVVEQVVLFSVGLAIALGFILTFSTFGNEAGESSKEKQLTIFAHLIASHITSVYEAGDHVELRFDLPKAIAGEEYDIDITTGAVSILTGGGRESVVGVKGVEERVLLSGGVDSNFRRARLIYDGDTIRLEGFT